MELDSWSTKCCWRGHKWFKKPQFSLASRWFQGPEFLWQPETKWPISGLSPGLTHEERIHHIVHISKIEFLIDFSRFSNSNRLVKSIAYAIRFLQNWKRNRRTNTKWTHISWMCYYQPDSKIILWKLDYLFKKQQKLA